jgi:hypothetical protein
LRRTGDDASPRMEPEHAGLAPSATSIVPRRAAVSSIGHSTRSGPHDVDFRCFHARPARIGPPTVRGAPRWSSNGLGTLIGLSYGIISAEGIGVTDAVLRATRCRPRPVLQESMHRPDHDGRSAGHTDVSIGPHKSRNAGPPEAVSRLVGEFAGSVT